MILQGLRQFWSINLDTAQKQTEVKDMKENQLAENLMYYRKKKDYRRKKFLNIWGSVVKL